MIRSLIDRLHLPVWARPDNPLVRRELQALPLFLGQDGNLNVKILLLAMVGLGLIPCSCSCGGLPWSLLQTVLSLAPLLWGALLINREQAAGTCDMLRTTPYSDAEIVLAKISAVLYRLSPLLALLVSGQAASILLSGLFTSTVFYSAAVSVNGAPARQVAPMLPEGSSALPAFMLALAAVLLTTLLDFVTNIVIGALASSLAAGRGTAYAVAIGLRILLSLGWVIFGLLALPAILPGFDTGNALVVSAVMYPGIWLALAAPDSGLGSAILAAGLMLAGQGALLAGLFRLVVWRAARA